MSSTKIKKSLASFREHFHRQKDTNRKEFQIALEYSSSDLAEFLILKDHLLFINVYIRGKTSIQWVACKMKNCIWEDIWKYTPVHQCFLLISILVSSNLWVILQHRSLEKDSFLISKWKRLHCNSGINTSKPLRYEDYLENLLLENFPPVFREANAIYLENACN